MKHKQITVTLLIHSTDRSVDMDNESDDDDDSYSSDQENSDSGENMVGGQVRSQLHAHQLPWNVSLV